MATATKTDAFEGRVTFHTLPLSLRTTIEADALQPHLNGAFVEHEDMGRNLVHTLAVTETIAFAFDGNENAMLLDLKQFWTDYEGAKSHKAKMKLATEWYMDASSQVLTAWYAAVNAAERPYVNPVIAPLAELSDEDRAEAEDANSPLAVSAEPSEGG